MVFKECAVYCVHNAWALSETISRIISQLIFGIIEGKIADTKNEKKLMQPVCQYVVRWKFDATLRKTR